MTGFYFLMFQVEQVWNFKIQASQQWLCHNLEWRLLNISFIIRACTSWLNWSAQLLTKTMEESALATNGSQYWKLLPYWPETCLHHPRILFLFQWLYLFRAQTAPGVFFWFKHVSKKKTKCQCFVFFRSVASIRCRAWFSHDWSKFVVIYIW